MIDNGQTSGSRMSSRGSLWMLIVTSHVTEDMANQEKVLVRF